MRILRYVPRILNFWSSKEKNNREGKREKYLKKENIWSAEEKKTEEEKEREREENIWRRKLFGQWRRRKTEKEKEEIIWSAGGQDGPCGPGGPDGPSGQPWWKK